MVAYKFCIYDVKLQIWPLKIINCMCNFHPPECGIFLPDAETTPSQYFSLRSYVVWNHFFSIKVQEL